MGDHHQHHQHTTYMDHHHHHQLQHLDPSASHPHSLSSAPAPPSHSQSQSQSPLDHPSQRPYTQSQSQSDPVRPLRAMLARGAACDTCRARKVKCDASRPFCAPCLKSARGDASVAQSKCTYEGTSVAAAREAALAAREANGAANGAGGAAKRKRKSNAAATLAAGSGSNSHDGAGESSAKRGRVDSAGSAGSGAGSLTQGEYGTVPAWTHQHHHHQPQHPHQHQQPLLPAAAAAYAAAQHPQQHAYGHPSTHPGTSSSSSALPISYAVQPASTQPLEYRPPAVPAPAAGPAPTSRAQYGDPLSSSDTTPATTRAPPHGDASSASANPPAPAPAPPPRERERVEDLEGRILELERALRAAAAAPVPAPLAASTHAHAHAHGPQPWYAGGAPLPHTRSPSFPYASYLPPPSSSSAAASSAPGIGGGAGGPASPYGTGSGAGAGWLAGGAGAGGSPSIGGIGAGSFFASGPTGAAERQQGAASPLGLLPPIGSGSGAGAGAGVGSPRGGAGAGYAARTTGGGGDYPSRRSSLSALSAAAGLQHREDGPGMGGGWAAASPLSSLRGTGAESLLLAGSPRGMLSSLRGTGMGTGVGTGTGMGTAGHTPASSSAEGGAGTGSGSGSGGSSTSGTTPAGGGPSPLTTDEGSGKPTAASSASAHTGVIEEVEPTGAGGGAAASDGIDTFELDEFALTPELYSLLHPAYPSSLPPISTLHHLVSTFFTRASVPATMLGRAGILTSLAYGPADPRWPDEALLHAMCAYGAQYVSTASLSAAEGLAGGQTALGLQLGEGERGRRSAYWEREGDRSPREYHYRHARRSIEASLQAGGTRRRKMLQVVQATVLTCYTAYQSAQFTDLWFLAGLAMRLCTPLGLNHLDPWDFATGRCGPEQEDWGVRVRFVERQDLLDAPRSVEEHWERATTWWMAFAVDRFASASTDWSTSIDEKDITTHLPCISPYPLPSLEIDPATGLIPSLSITSPAFLDDTSAPIGSLGLYIKATVLLGRVVNYLQRLPRNKCVKRGAACSAVKAAAKARPDFIELDVALSRFKEDVGPRLYDAVGDGIDGFLVSAYCIPHVATILLHEGFTDRYERDPTSSLSRCLAAAKCVVNAMHVLYGSAHDVCGGDPYQPFYWSVAGRALVRDYATRRLWGEADEAEASRALAESCLQFHEQCEMRGSGIAGTLAKTLRRHLDNPDILLPIDGDRVGLA